MLLITNWIMMILFILAALASIASPFILITSVSLAAVFAANINYIRKDRK
jgi:hypothetical protein